MTKYRVHFLQTHSAAASKSVAMKSFVDVEAHRVTFTQDGGQYEFHGWESAPKLVVPARNVLYIEQLEKEKE